MGVTTQAHQSKLYYELSHIYDLVFARVFYPRIAKVIRSLDIRPGERILEIGAGTGSSLGCYPEHCEVLGIDLAPEMLEHAQDKIDRHGWRHIRVATMDAMNLDLPDSSFDYVMAFHVVSVVPDVRGLMREAQRVCRPGGQIVVINHFRSRQRWLAAIDRWLEPLTRWLGWHTLDRNEVFAGTSIEPEEIYKTSARSLFTIVKARNAKPEPVVESVEVVAPAGIDGAEALAH